MIFIIVYTNKLLIRSIFWNFYSKLWFYFIKTAINPILNINILIKYQILFFKVIKIRGGGSVRFSIFIWNRFGTSLKPVWNRSDFNRFGTDFKLAYNRFGTVYKPVWVWFGTHLISFLKRFFIFLCLPIFYHFM